MIWYDVNRRYGIWMKIYSDLWLWVIISLPFTSLPLPFPIRNSTVLCFTLLCTSMPPFQREKVWQWCAKPQPPVLFCVATTWTVNTSVIEPQWTYRWKCIQTGDNLMPAGEWIKMQVSFQACNTVHLDMYDNKKCLMMITYQHWNTGINHSSN